MKGNLKRFAPAGLALSLVAVIIAVGLFIVRQKMDWIVGLFFGLTVIGLALFAILDPNRTRQALTGRQARYGSNAAIMTIAFLGILVVVNLLSYGNSKSWDLTQDKSNTLSPETIAVLTKAETKITATAFFTTQISQESALKLLDSYKANSKGKFDFKFIDPNSDMVAAQAAKIKTDGSVLLQIGQRQEVVTNATEQDITAALIRLSGSGQKVIYVLNGHDEYDLSGTDQKGLSEVKSVLEQKGYVVKPLALITDRKIPEDAAVILIAGSQKPVSVEEVALIKDYVAKGGSLMVLSSPLPMTQFGTLPDPLADYLNETWGITLGKDFVIDPTDPQNPSAAYSDLSQYGNHPITQGLSGKLYTAFPGSRSVTIRTLDSVTQVYLVKTNSAAYGKNIDELVNNQTDFTKEKDLAGPVPLAVAGESLATQSRIVVVGNSTFVVNGNVTAYGNQDFFINSVDWAAKQDAIINLTPKQTTQRVVLTPQSYTMGLIFLGSVIGMPLLVILSGILVWLQRRRQG
jgi:ABC-type uncharacterized transport system involved in gliding motility auxiliary subunit